MPVDLPVRPWPVTILTLKNRTLSPVVERFIERLREAAKSFAETRRAHDTFVETEFRQHRPRAVCARKLAKNRRCKSPTGKV